MLVSYPALPGMFPVDFCNRVNEVICSKKPSNISLDLRPIAIGLMSSAEMSLISFFSFLFSFLLSLAGTSDVIFADDDAPAEDLSSLSSPSSEEADARTTTTEDEEKFLLPLFLLRPAEENGAAEEEPPPFRGAPPLRKVTWFWTTTNLREWEEEEEEGRLLARAAAAAELVVAQPNGDAVAATTI